VITLRPYTAQDAIEILGQRPRQPGVQLDEQTRAWAAMKETRGPAITGIVDGRIIGCGGLEILWPGVAEGWCLFVGNVDDFRLPVAKAVKRTLHQWIKDHHLVRVQAPLRADFKSGILFATWLGLKYEGTLRKYLPDGSDAMMYALIGE
jgi:hypothetical protein